MTVTRKRTTTVLLAAALALLLYGRFAGAARADTFDVSTPQELQAAASAAAQTAGPDTINLAAGVYHIGSTIGRVTVYDSGTTLIGAGPHETILDGDGAGNVFPVIAADNGGTIRDLTVRNGFSGITGFNGEVTIANVVARDNTTGLDVGAVDISNSTVTANTDIGIRVEGQITAVNTTVANNGGEGLQADAPGSAVENLTIAGNGGSGLRVISDFEIDNSIIAGNAGGDCDIDRGRTLAGHHDLVGDGGCGLAGTGVLSDDPLLGPLQDNGGSTPTMALGAASPAIDAGDDAVCPATDQRGVARPQGAHCDLGAFELAVATDSAPSCSPYGGSVGTGGSLQDAVSCSDPDAGDNISAAAVTNPGHGTLVLNGDGSFTYTPDAGFSGNDSFAFQATDSHGAASNVATATIEVDNTPVGTDVSVFPAFASVTVTFATVATAGVTTATSSLTGPPLAGFQVPGASLYWDLSTTATYTAPIEVCLPLPVGVPNPRLLHYENGAWVDATTRVTGSQVCGSVSSLSPFVVAVPVAQLPSTLTYTGATTAVFGPVTFSASLVDAGTSTGLADRAVSFAVDGGAPILATTAADGTVSATTPLPLAPGAHAVVVSFAGDDANLGSQVEATVTVVDSARGSVTAPALLFASGAASLHVQVGSGGKLAGYLLYTNGRRLYLAATITAFGIGADGHSAWVAAEDAAGHTFLAYALDASGHGDKLRLWLDGTLLNGDGSLRLGLVHVDPRH